MNSPETEQALAVYNAEKQRIEILQQYKNTLDTLVSEAAKLATERYDDEEDAEDVATVFADEWMLKLKEAMMKAGDPEVRASGPEVAVPTHDVSTPPNSIMIILKDGEPLRPQHFPDTTLGTMDYLYGFGRETQDGQYVPQVSAVVVYDLPDVAVVNENYPFPLVEGHLMARAVVSLTEGANFDVPELDQRVQDLEVIDRAARSGLKKTALMRIIGEIDDEMRGVDEDDYQELDDPERLAKIARYSVDYVNTGVCSRDMIEDLLNVLLKKGRSLELKLKPDEEGEEPEEIEGKVLQLYLAGIGDKVDSLKLSLETVNDDGETVPEEIPLERVLALSY